MRVVTYWNRLPATIINSLNAPQPRSFLTCFNVLVCVLNIFCFKSNFSKLNTSTYKLQWLKNTARAYSWVFINALVLG